MAVTNLRCLNNESKNFKLCRTYSEPTEQQDLNQGAILEPTLLELDPVDGSIISRWGRNMSYVPHGLTIDDEGFFWITDITKHQVLNSYSL